MHNAPTGPRPKTPVNKSNPRSWKLAARICKLPWMSGFPIRSPASKVQGLVYFGRMLDKIRLHAEGKLPEDYRPNLGEKMDSHCVNFLRVRYDQLVERLKEGGADEEILRWCLTHGRQPSQEDVMVWNEFMRKRGWN